jgi:hypothetical protein
MAKKAKAAVSVEDAIKEELDCKVMFLDMEGPLWKAKMEKIRKDRIHKNGSEEINPRVEIGYRTAKTV